MYNIRICNYYITSKTNYVGYRHKVPTQSRVHRRCTKTTLQNPEDDGRARIRILVSSTIRWLEPQGQKRAIAIQRPVQRI